MIYPTKRHSIWILLALILAGAWGVWILKVDRVTEENYRKIREGMCLADVTAILGPEVSDSVLVLPLPLGHGIGQTIDDTRWGNSDSIEGGLWMGQDRLIAVRFDENGKLCEKTLIDISKSPKPNLLQRIQAKLESFFK